MPTALITLITLLNNQRKHNSNYTQLTYDSLHSRTFPAITRIKSQLTVHTCIYYNESCIRPVSVAYSLLTLSALPHFIIIKLQFATTIHATSPLIGRRQYVYFFTRQPRFHYHATQDTIAMVTQLQATLSLYTQQVHTSHFCAT